ncbi:hypothetical protein [Streptomyces sp. NPDC008265]|uniref:hypothetical protein n=1 Tax=Streptomyces sp. NPDC008265 TaxID=3364824 RepID=UPI0036E40099
MAESDALGSGLVSRTATEHLAALVLDCFPHDLGTGLSVPEGRSVHGGTWQRAARFNEENAHRDIGIADIAAAAGVTPRAVGEVEVRCEFQRAPHAHPALLGLRVEPLRAQGEEHQLGVVVPAGQGDVSGGVHECLAGVEPGAPAGPVVAPRERRRRPGVHDHHMGRRSTSRVRCPRSCSAATSP